MTTVIIPTRHRPDMLIRCLDSLMAAEKVPHRTVVVVDEDPETVLTMAAYEGIVTIMNQKNLGFWQSLNRVFEICSIAEDEPFCYFGKDVTFDGHWLEEAEGCFTQSFPDGLGLLTFKDDQHNGANASHGMTTRRWFTVVYGEPFFPSDYFHHYCDSELTLRSRDLGRFAYCAASYVPHHHEPTGLTARNHDDKVVQDRRYLEWKGGGLKAAGERMKSL